MCPANKFDELISEMEGEPQPQSAAKEAVLVIDDDTTQLKSLEQILSGTYALFMADKGKKGIELYRANTDKIKAILLDIRLPDMEGFEVFGAIKEINENIPIIFITGFQDRYGNGIDIFKKYRPFGYIIKNQEGETRIIMDTLSSAVEIYNKISEKIKQKEKIIINNTMSGLLHDLKNMFIPIVHGPELLRNYAKSGEQKKYTDFLNDLEKMIKIFSYTQDLMFKFSRGIEVKPVLLPCNVTQVMEEFCHLSSIRFEANLRIVSDFHYQGEFKTDKNMLVYQAVLNIVKNAYEAFHAKEGCVTLKTFSYEEYCTVYGVHARFRDKQLRDLMLVISDNGPGMPADVATHYFEEYYTHGKLEGTGLGGYMVRLCIEDMLKGKIILENVAGQGVTFHIWLPQL